MKKRGNISLPRILAMPLIYVFLLLYFIKGASQECPLLINPNNGELVVLNPEITFPDTIGICQDSNTNIISAIDSADGYRWYKVGPNDSEVLIFSNADILISEQGTYVHEVYNIIAEMGEIFECTSSKVFRVENSEKAQINDLRVTQQGNGINLIVEVESIGHYAVTLDNEDGPYQNINRFNGIAPGNHTVYVRDKNGSCTVQESIQQDITMNGFPNFFTSNGDGVNDFWQYIPPVEMTESTNFSISIFEKYSNLLAQINPQSQGWDDRFNDNALPESTYLFNAISIGKRGVKGYFS